MRRFITGLSVVAAGTAFTGCSSKPVVCPAPDVGFSPIVLSNSLASWDHANAVFDGALVVVAHTQGAVGDPGASSVLATPVSCDGRAGASVLMSSALSNGEAPAMGVGSSFTWLVWSTGQSTTFEPPADAGDGGTSDDGGLSDGGTTDGGSTPKPGSSVRQRGLTRGTDEPTPSDTNVPVTRRGGAFTPAVQVSQMVSSPRSVQALAGARPLVSETCLSPFVQRYLFNGSLPVDGVNDLEPSAATGCLVGPTALAGVADEELYFAWSQRSETATDADPTALIFARWTEGRTSLENATTVEVANFISAPIAASGTEENNPPRYLAYFTRADAASAYVLKVIDLKNLGTAFSQLEVPLTGTPVGRPLLAGAEGSGAVAWTVEDNAGARQMFVQRFTYTNATFAPTEPVFDLSDRASVTAGTAEALTAVTGSSFFVVWSEQRSSAERGRLQGGYLTFQADGSVK